MCVDCYGSARHINDTSFVSTKMDESYIIRRPLWVVDGNEKTKKDLTVKRLFLYFEYYVMYISHYILIYIRCVHSLADLAITKRQSVRRIQKNVSN